MTWMCNGTSSNFVQIRNPSSARRVVFKYMKCLILHIFIVFFRIIYKCNTFSKGLFKCYVMQWGVSNFPEKSVMKVSVMRVGGCQFSRKKALRNT